MSAMLGLLLLLLAVSVASATTKNVVINSDEELVGDEDRLALIGKRSCPNNCSGHGRCNGNSCVCNTESSSLWYGVDCSIFVQQTTSGLRYSGSVESGLWTYYTIRLSSSSIDNMSINLVQTSRGDVDVYVRHAMLPTRARFDYDDLTLRTNFTINVPNPENGYWYVGVYGFQGCSYTIEVDAEAESCPSHCHDHGTCLDNKCQCFIPYFGSSCQDTMPVLSSTPLYGFLTTGAWMYYRVTPPAGTTKMTIALNETSRGDSDMFISNNGLVPSQFQWSYRDISVDPNYEISIGEPESVQFIVGVYGYSTVNFQIYALVESGALCNETRCSDHGQCAGSSCSCHSGFIGRYCQTMNGDMPIHTAVQGFVTDNMWNYYHILATTANNMVVSVQQLDGEANPDCDVYIKADEIPTGASFDYRDQSVNSDFSITVENPQDVLWYIGVFGFTPCSYEISVSFTLSCPGDCNGHGSCLMGRCQCAAEYIGEGCEYRIQELYNETPITLQSVQLAQYSYYNTTVPRGYSSFTVSMHETATVGMLWLYVGLGSPPAINNYIVSDTSRTTSYHNAWVSVTPDENHTFYVAVYGSPYAPANTDVPFEIVAYYPPWSN